MKYVQKLSLQHMANIKIAATLCNQAEVKDLLKKSFCTSYSSHFILHWVEIEAIVAKNIAKLPLPQRMKEEILFLIRPVGFEISKWREFHFRCYDIRVGLPHEFYWTPQGTIDKKKTAKVMIKDQNMDITTRYKLACVYCLEDEIKRLWDKIPEGLRKYFYSQDDPKLVRQNELVIFWTYYIKGEMDKMGRLVEERMQRQYSPYQYVFEVAARGGNRVATEYFLQKLTPAKRDESLVYTAKCMLFGHVPYFNDINRFMKDPFSHILLLILRELNEDKQLEVFKRSPHTILMCFLDWPLQTFFMETANRMWHFLDEKKFGKLLLHIIGKITHGYKDFDYRKLFGTFWEQSPNDFKKHVFRVSFFRRIVSDLFKNRDKNNLKVIFQDATPKDKYFLIYNNDAQDICWELMNGNQLSLLKFFIKGCLPSKNEVIEFKKYFENGGVWCVWRNRMGNWGHKFLRVLDDVICEFKKMKCDEGDSTKAKRVCTADYHGVTLYLVQRNRRKSIAFHVPLIIINSKL